MSVTIHVPVRAARVAVTVTLLLAAVLLVGLWGDRAHADHDPDASLHICVRSNGNLRLGTDCRRDEARHVLATDGSVQAAQARVEELEAETAALEERVAELEAAGPDEQASGERDAASTDPTTAEVPCDEGGPCNPSTMEQRVSALETTLAGVTRTTVNGKDTLRFSGMNVQIVNGTGTTWGTPNGVGNLLVGYDIPRESGSDKSGSHYLVVGDEHNYTSFGGIVAGLRNTATGWWASVTGGRNNTVSGDYASVSAGFNNTASGSHASVSGGFNNTASGDYASVSAGDSNTASGAYASVSGGWLNTASVSDASVSGGYNNTASGLRSSILGGSNRMVATGNGCHPSCA